MPQSSKIIHAWPARTIVAILLAMSGIAAHAAEALKVRTLAIKHSGEIFRIEVSNDSRHAITTATTPTESSVTDLKLWDIASGKVLFADDKVRNAVPFDILDGHAVRYETAGSSPPQRRMILVATGRTIATLRDDEWPLNLVVNGAATELVTFISGKKDDDTRVDDIVRVHSGGSSSVHQTFKLEGTAAAEGTRRRVVSTNGKWLAYTMKGSVTVVDLASGSQRSRPVGGDTGSPPIVGFSIDGSVLYTLSGDRDLQRWSVADLGQLSDKPVTLDDAGPAWKDLSELQGGGILRLEGTRSTAFVDVMTGKMYSAARGISVNRYLLTEINNTLFLRGSRSRSNPTTWGLIQHANGDFTEVFNTKGRVALGSLVTSRNGRCLTLLTTAKLAIVDPVSRREIGSATGLPKGLYRGLYTPDGRQFIATSETGEIALVATPKVCQT